MSKKVSPESVLRSWKNVSNAFDVSEKTWPIISLSQKWARIAGGRRKWRGSHWHASILLFERINLLEGLGWDATDSVARSRNCCFRRFFESINTPSFCCKQCCQVCITHWIHALRFTGRRWSSFDKAVPWLAIFRSNKKQYSCVWKFSEYFRNY